MFFQLVREKMNCFKFLLLAAACFSAIKTTVLARNVIGVEPDEGDLANWCKKPVALTKISQLEFLVGKLDGCEGRVKEALTKFKEFIDETKLQQCSMESVGKYQDYYERYLDTSSEVLKKLNGKLPAPLRTFALAYGLELSGLCRLNMVKVLIRDVRKVLPEADFESVQGLVDPMGPIAQTLRSGGKRPDDLLLPSDFAISSTGAPRKDLVIKIATTKVMKKLKLICKRRFEPIYGPLMMPVAKLANMGFEFRSKDLKETLKENAKDCVTYGDIGKWSQIVFLCEGLRNVQLIEDPKYKQSSVGNDATVVQVFDNEEEAEEAMKSLGGNGEDLLDRAEVDENKYKLLEFEPDLSVQMPDEVVRSFFSKQTLSLSRINTNRDERMRIKMRFFSRTYRMLTSDLKHLRFKEFFGYFVDKVKEQAKIIKKGGVVENTNMAEELIKIFNERVNDELNPELAVSDDLDDCCCLEMCCCWMLLCGAANNNNNNNYSFSFSRRHHRHGGYHGGYYASHSSGRGGPGKVLVAICIIIVIGFLAWALTMTIMAIAAG